MKMMVAGFRVPVGSLSISIDGGETWLDMARSGDNYWQPVADLPQVLDEKRPLAIMVTCGDGEGAKVLGSAVVPASCLCAYQDPDCKHCISKVQCPE